MESREREGAGQGEPCRGCVCLCVRAQGVPAGGGSGCTLALCSAALVWGSAAEARVSPDPSFHCGQEEPRARRRLSLLCRDLACHGLPPRRPPPPPPPAARAPCGVAVGSVWGAPAAAAPAPAAAATRLPPAPGPPSPAATFSRGRTSRLVPHKTPAAASPLAALPSGASPPPHPNKTDPPSLRPQRETHTHTPPPQHKCTITGEGREREERARDAKKEGGKGEREEKLKGHKAVHHQHGCLSSDLKEE